MVNTLSGSVCAYRKETVKPRFIRIDEVMALLDVTQDEAKERFKDIFDKAEQIRELDDAESCYQSGDTFFEDEHNAWERLNTELLAQGYSVEEVESLRKKYESKYAQDCKAERAVSKELSLGRSIWKKYARNLFLSGQRRTYRLNLMRLLSVQIKKYGGEVLAVMNGRQALRLVLMERNVRYVLVRE